MSERYIVQPVYKALQVLRLLGEERRELTLSEICYRVGLPKTTVYRYLYTLSACGFISHDSNTDLYRVGLRLWELGQLSESLVELRTVALPFMRALRDLSNETVNLGVLEGNEVVYLEMIESRRSLRMQAQLGNRDPVYSTALGKAILAFTSREQWHKHLPDHFESRTPRTLIAIEELELDLQRSYQRGYAVDDEENEEGARCIGAPIFNHQGIAVAAVSLSAPSNRLNNSQLQGASRQTVQTAEAISRSLGYTPPAHSG